MNISSDSSHEPHYIVLYGTLEDTYDDQKYSETSIDLMTSVSTVKIGKETVLTYIQ